MFYYAKIVYFTETLSKKMLKQAIVYLETSEFEYLCTIICLLFINNIDSLSNGKTGRP